MELVSETLDRVLVERPSTSETMELVSDAVERLSVPARLSAPHRLCRLSRRRERCGPRAFVSTADQEDITESTHWLL